MQRVEKAKVIRMSDKKVVGGIGRGLFILIGIKKGDTEKNADFLAEKISKLRVMADKEEKMNLSVKDINGELLVVSQFTLHADLTAGNRPSFIEAEEPVRAKALYQYFVDKLKEKGIKVETGSFGNYQQVEVILDGTVTILYLD